MEGSKGRESVWHQLTTGVHTIEEAYRDTKNHRSANKLLAAIESIQLALKVIASDYLQEKTMAAEAKSRPQKYQVETNNRFDPLSESEESDDELSSVEGPRGFEDHDSMMEADQPPPKLQKQAQKRKPADLASPLSIPEFGTYISAFKTIQTQDKLDKLWAVYALSRIESKLADSVLIKLFFIDSPSCNASYRLWESLSPSQQRHLVQAWNKVPIQEQIKTQNQWERGNLFPPAQPFDIRTGQENKPYPKPKKMEEKPTQAAEPSTSEGTADQVKPVRTPQGWVIDGSKHAKISDVYKELKSLAPNITFKKVELLEKGGIYLLPTKENREEADKLFTTAIPATAFNASKPLHIHRPGETGKVFDKANENKIVVKNVDRHLLIEDITSFIDEPISEVLWLTKEGKRGMIRIEFKEQERAKHYIKQGKIAIASVLHNCEPCLPNPKVSQCFKCQKWGHVAVRCPNSLRCLRCGDAHQHKDCPNNREQAKCPNCDQNHPSFSKTCAAYLDFKTQHLEKLRKQVKTQQNFRPAPPPAENAWETKESSLKSAWNIAVDRLIEAIRDPELNSVESLEILARHLFDPKYVNSSH